MNRILKIRLLPVFMVITLLAFSGCFGGSDSGSSTTGTGGTTTGGTTTGGTTTVYENKNVPATFKIELPKSLKITSSAARSHKPRHMRSIKQSRTGTSGSTTQSTGYMQLKNMISMVDEGTQSLEIELMIIDAALQQLSGEITTDKTYSYDEGDFTITWTQEMYNKEKELYATWGYEADEDELTPVGTQLPNPKLTYTRDLADGDSDGYNHSITFYYEDEEDNSVYTGSYTIKWNTESTKIMISDQYTDTYTSEYATYTYKGSDKIIYEDVNGKAKMNVVWSNNSGDTETKMTFNFTEIGSNNGVLIDATFNNSYGTNQPYFTSSSYSIEGLADDNGGFVNTIATYVSPAYNPETGTMTPTSSKSYYKESFDGMGNLISASYSSDGTNWQPVTGYTAYNTEDCDYDDDYTEYQEEVNANTINFTVSGGIQTEGTIYAILPAGTSTSKPTTEEEISELENKTIGVAFYTSGEWQIDYWGTEEQASQGFVIFSVIFNETDNGTDYIVEYEPTVTITKTARK